MTWTLTSARLALPQEGHSRQQLLVQLWVNLTHYNSDAQSLLDTIITFVAPRTGYSGTHAQGIHYSGTYTQGVQAPTHRVFRHQIWLHFTNGLLVSLWLWHVMLFTHHCTPLWSQLLHPNLLQSLRSYGYSHWLLLILATHSSAIYFASHKFNANVLLCKPQFITIFHCFW